MLRRVAALALAALALSGCLGAATPGRDELVVRVTDEPGGPPVAGVAVRAHRPGIFWSYNDEAMTGADGLARFAAPDGVTLSAEPPGFTPERMGGVVPSGAVVELPLFRSKLAVQLDGVAMGGAVGIAAGPVERRWTAHDVPFGRSDEARRGYAERVLRVEATLAWTNGPAAAGDLGVGLGTSRDAPQFWRDARDETSLGEHRERLVVTGEELGDVDRGATRLFAGPGGTYASAAGLAYTLTLVGEFGPRRDAPGATMGAVAALAIAALLLARRR